MKPHRADEHESRETAPTPPLRLFRYMLTGGLVAVAVAGVLGAGDSPYRIRLELAAAFIGLLFVALIAKLTRQI